MDLFQPLIRCPIILCFKKKLVKPINVIWHYKLVMGNTKRRSNKCLFWDTITVLSLFVTSDHISVLFTLSSRADILSLRWSWSLSLDSDRSLSTVSDRRLLCSSFIFSRCRAFINRKTTFQNVRAIRLICSSESIRRRPGVVTAHFHSRIFLTLSSSWFFSSSWASICLSLSSTFPWRSSA